jgi:hypothetical protein
MVGWLVGFVQRAELKLFFIRCKELAQCSALITISFGSFENSFHSPEAAGIRSIFTHWPHNQFLLEFIVGTASPQIRWTPSPSKAKKVFIRRAVQKLNMWIFGICGLEVVGPAQIQFADQIPIPYLHLPTPHPLALVQFLLSRGDMNV